MNTIIKLFSNKVPERRDPKDVNYKKDIYSKSIKLAKLLYHKKLTIDKLQKNIFKYPTILSEEYDSTFIKDMNEIFQLQKYNESQFRILYLIKSDVFRRIKDIKKITFYGILMYIMQFTNIDRIDSDYCHDILKAIWNSLEEINKDLMLYHFNVNSIFFNDKIIDLYFNFLITKKVDLNVRKDLLFSDEIVPKYLYCDHYLRYINVERYINFIKKLINTGLNINHKNKEGNNFIHNIFEQTTITYCDFIFSQIIDNINYFKKHGLESDQDKKLVDIILKNNDGKSFARLLCTGNVCITQENFNRFLEIIENEMFHNEYVSVHDDLVFWLITALNFIKSRKEIDISQNLKHIIDIGFRLFKGNKVEVNSNYQADILHLNDTLAMYGYNILGLLFKFPNNRVNDAPIKFILNKYKKDIKFQDIVKMIKPVKSDDKSEYYTKGLLANIIYVYKDQLNFNIVKAVLLDDHTFLIDLCIHPGLNLKSFKDETGDIFSFLKENDYFDNKDELIEIKFIKNSRELLIQHKEFHEKYIKDISNTDELMNDFNNSIVSLLNNMDKKKVHKMLKQVDDNGNTFLHLIAADRNDVLIKYMVSNYESVDIRNKKGQLPGDVYKNSSIEARLGISNGDK